MNTLDEIFRHWNGDTHNGQVIEIPNVGRNDLAHLFAQLDFTKGAEIGTERGLYAEVLCKANPALELFCVDPYRAYREYREHTTQSKLDGFYTEARERLRSYNVTFIRKPSVEASAEVLNDRLDFVYIDGNHLLPYVINDLWYWTPKVRPGGIVAGHDYRRRKANDRYKVHVVEAVHAYVQAMHVKPLLILGRKEVRAGETRDEPRSWMFVKD